MKIGGTTRIAQMTNTNPDHKTHNETRGDWSLPDKAMARASRTQAATSLTAAADIANLPISVVKSFSSARIRAKTGKAVIERATPMNTRKAVKSTPLEMVALRTNDEPIPNANGRLIPTTDMARAFFPV